MREIELGAPQDAFQYSASDENWTALIKMVAEGDQLALSALFDATSRLVFGLVLRILGDCWTAEEVLIDVYAQVWRQASLYDTRRGSPMAWLMTLARSRATDRLRSERIDRQRKEPLDSLIDLSATTPSPEEETALSERQRMVRKALDELSPEQREVIELAYYSGLSHSEIALKLNQPLGTVKTRTRQGMIKMRKALAPLLKGSESFGSNTIVIG